MRYSSSLLLKNSPGMESPLIHHSSKDRVQPKLSVNMPGDKYEQEADAMANRVMQADRRGNAVSNMIGPSIQRKCAECEEEDRDKKTIMRKMANGNAVAQPSHCFASSLAAAGSSGAPLPAGTKSFMENAFSKDFSSVRIHTGGEASAMNQSINAKAFTYGKDIFFNDGAYSPGNYEGKKLLAHELTHVVQQGGSGKTIQRFDNCSDPQNRIISTTLARARRRCAGAVALMVAIQGGTNRAAAASLRRYFGSLTAAQITTIHDKIVAANARLANNAVWRCDTAATYAQCGGTDNWWAGTACPTTADPTHLCPPVFSATSDVNDGIEPSRSATLIHEALRAAGACDGFYPPGDRTPPGSLTNVYSYTRFIYSNT